MQEEQVNVGESERQMYSPLIINPQRKPRIQYPNIPRYN